MTAILLVFGIILVAIFLFATEKVPVEVTALTVVCLIAATGVLTAEEAFGSFGNETVIFIFTLLAMTEGLVATGAMHRIGARFTQLSRFGQRGFMAALLSLVAVTSAFVSNTVITAALLPAAVHAARSAGVPRRSLLMPLAFASMLGGMMFLYGTSTNLVVSERLDQLGLGRIGLLELAPAGLPAAVVGVLFLVLVSPRLLRRRGGESAQSHRRAFLAEAVVEGGRLLRGRSVAWLERWCGMGVKAVVRGGKALGPSAELPLLPGDRLLLEGRRRDVMRLRYLRGLHICGESSSPDPSAPPESVAVAEALVHAGSALAGRTAEEAGLTHEVTLLAVYPHVSVLHSHDATRPLARHRLHPGDLLLLSGPREQVEALGRKAHLLSVSGVEELRQAGRRRALLAPVIFATALVVGSLGLLPLAVAGLGGLLVMLFTRCVPVDVVFRIDWRVVLMIGSMMTLGLAVEESGAGALAGGYVAQLASTGGPMLVLLVLMGLTVLLSIPMSNQAAALVMLPVAVSAAAALDVNPRALVMGVALAASCAFATPLEPSAMLVFGPGRYRFADYLKVGGPLTLVMLVALVLLVPRVWGL